MQETKVARDDEENIEECRDDIKPLQTVKEDTMDKSGDPPGTDNGSSEDGSGTGSQLSEPSIKGQETDPVTTSTVSEVAQESERGFSAFDLNEEFCNEEKPECSLSGARSNSKPRSVCLDIDLNVADAADVADDNGEESSVGASPWKPTMLHLDLNACQSMSQSCSSSSSSSSSMKNFDLNFSSNDQNAVISLFGTQVEVDPRGTGSSPIGRVLEPASKGGWPGWGHGGFAPGPSMYMVDPRRVPMAPQFAPPFFMNMAGGACFGPTGAGPNLGLMMNGGNSGGLSSLVGGKRKEPEGGWEGFPVEYKQQQPRWK